MSALENAKGKPSFWLAATKDQARDTGMALVLVCLIVFLVTRQHRYVSIGALILLVNMAVARPSPSSERWTPGFSR